MDVKRKILHTMLRVADIERSIDFYTGVLGMSLIRRFENSTGMYTLAFLGYGEEHQSAVLELTYNQGVSSYQHGNAFGHIAVGVDDCSAFCDQIKLNGGKIIREPGKLKGGEEIIAFADDPDGYRIEIIERPDSWFV